MADNITKSKNKSSSISKLLKYCAAALSVVSFLTTIEQTNGYKVQISFINLQKTADIAINERTYIYDRCTLQLPPGRYSLH